MMKNRYTLHLLLFMGLVLVCVACGRPTVRVASATVVEALSYTGDESFARAIEPIDFHFPADHGSHPEYRTEWWYYTGNLENQDGAEYGYQLTFFRSALTSEFPERESELATNQIYMAHFALTDAASERHHSFERFARGRNRLAGATGLPHYEVWLDGWTARQIEPDSMQLVASVESENGIIAIDLTLDTPRSPLLHGDRGLSQKGPEAGNSNYYYSLVKMETIGTIQLNGEEHSVTGLSWMDHEFGTFALSNGARGWDWFSVTLENGMVFMFGELQYGKSKGRFLCGGTLAYADGRQFSLGQDDFEINILAEWTSPRSGITYPARWLVHFPTHDIELEIEPIIADQEMNVSFIYYEGATRVTGMIDGEEIQGQGYVELTGYSNRSED